MVQAEDEADRTGVGAGWGQWAGKGKISLWNDLEAEPTGLVSFEFWGREDEERDEFRGGRDPDTLERRSSRGSGRSGSGHSPARPDLLPSGSPVCADSNHVRTWSVTRFRGMISTQPGSTPLASFKILALESADGHGGCSAGNDIGASCPWAPTPTDPA